MADSKQAPLDAEAAAKAAFASVQDQPFPDDIFTAPELRWAVIGCGVIANQMAQSLALAGRKLAGVANRTPSKAQAFAEQYGVEKVYETVEDLYADPDIDAVYITTPHNTHITYLRAALAAGKHVLCEKAITLNSAELDEARAIADEHNVVVTSYDLMRRDIDEYVEQDFARVVLDEAQYIKNPLTQVARAAKRLPAGVRFALTGTPIENRLSELWSIFDFLMPGLLGTRESFAKRFESPVEHAEGDSAARLQALVSPFVLRRVKEDVVADLPEKIEDTVMAQLTGEQRKLYLANQDRIAQQVQHRESSEFKKDKLKVLAELTKLRQICCDPRLHYEDYKAGSAKLDTCMELVHGALDGGHRILLFSQFTGMLDIIGKRLAKEDIAFLKLTGASSKESRAKMVAQFQAGEVPVFLISLKAGGVGLNLTAADVVIHYDPWWNVAAQDQATDRAHRIGQQHTVTVYKLIAKDTIEERIMQMQESKRDLVNSVLGGDGISSALFTREDVLALLGGDGR